MVLLQYAGNTVGGEPGNGVVVGKGFKGTFHHAFTAWIGLTKGLDALEVVGQVASAPTGNGQLSHRLGTRLKDGYRQLRRPFPQQRGAKAPRRPGSYDGNCFHQLLDL